MSNIRWKVKDKTKIKKMLDGGSSYNMIALQFPNATRSMISGIIRREGWIGISKNDCYTNQRVKQVKPEPPSPKPEIKKVESLSPPKTAPTLFLNKVSFADLRSCHCHWTVSDEPRMYCGEMHDDDSSYCSYHHRMAIRPDRAK